MCAFFRYQAGAQLTRPEDHSRNTTPRSHIASQAPSSVSQHQGIDALDALPDGSAAHPPRLSSIPFDLRAIPSPVEVSPSSVNFADPATPTPTIRPLQASTRTPRPDLSFTCLARRNIARDKPEHLCLPPSIPNRNPQTHIRPRARPGRIGILPRASSTLR